MEKGLKVLLIIIIVIAVIVGGGYIALMQIAGNPADIVIEEVDISAIADGIYTGEYATTFVSAKVQVEIMDGQIMNIEVIEHEHGTNHGAYDVALYVVDAQKLNVDTVSSATMSSKVIMKAIEDALNH